MNDVLKRISRRWNEPPCVGLPRGRSSGGHQALTLLCPGPRRKSAPGRAVSPSFHFSKWEGTATASSILEGPQEILAADARLPTDGAEGGAVDAWMIGRRVEATKLRSSRPKQQTPTIRPPPVKANGSNSGLRSGRSPRLSAAGCTVASASAGGLGFSVREARLPNSAPPTFGHTFGHSVDSTPALRNTPVVSRRP